MIGLLQEDFWILATLAVVILVLFILGEHR